MMIGEGVGLISFIGLDSFDLHLHCLQVVNDFDVLRRTAFVLRNSTALSHTFAIVKLFSFRILVARRATAHCGSLFLPICSNMVHLLNLRTSFLVVSHMPPESVDTNATMGL